MRRWLLKQNEDKIKSEKQKQPVVYSIMYVLMAGWKELVIDVMKLTDETRGLNKDIDKLQSHVVEIDKRVVRLETLVEVSTYQVMQTKLTEDTK